MEMESEYLQKLQRQLEETEQEDGGAVQPKVPACQ